MEEVIKYKANDGRMFDVPMDCILYEYELMVLNKIINSLGERPHDSDFINGRGYIKHDTTNLRRVKDSLRSLTMQKLGTTIRRSINNSDHKSLKKAWNRFDCIDFDGKEWGQPFFAHNPGTGTGREIRR